MPAALRKWVIYLGAATLASLLAALPGCNTMAGAGKDISKAGDKIENSAERNKSY